MPLSPWQFVGTTARLRTAALTASVDPQRPSAGLRIEQLCGQTVACTELFGVQIDLPRDNPRADAAAAAVECFARGNDLIATFAETADRPFRAQIYWRFLDGRQIGSGEPPAPIAAVELIVSVQTSRLDIDTALSVCSTLGHVEAWQMLDADERLASNGGASLAAAAGAIRSGAAVVPDFSAAESRGCFLIRPSGSLPSYIEIVHPADFRQTTFELLGDSPPAVRLAHRLFAERLEKGVILRSRIRGLFVPRDAGSEVARREYRRFAASEPPLTV